MSVNQYPFNEESPRRLILAGKKEGGKLKGYLLWKPTRAELSPALQSPEERAKGTSTNAMVARLLGGSSAKKSGR